MSSSGGGHDVSLGGQHHFRPLGEKITMPSLVIMGADDPSTDAEQIFSHLNAVPGLRELLF